MSDPLGESGDDPDWRSDEEASRLRDEAFKRLFAAGRSPQEAAKTKKPRKLSRLRGENAGGAIGNDIPSRG